MSPSAVLPVADADTAIFFAGWLVRFSKYVRDVDYAAARPLFHPDILAFGTHRDVIQGIETWVRAQWDSVWPRTSDFHFALDELRVLVSRDASMATVIVPWTSAGYHKDGSPFDRPGRATMIFEQSDGHWLCIHSHMSLNRGVPQESFANRRAQPA